MNRILEPIDRVRATARRAPSARRPLLLGIAGAGRVVERCYLPALEHSADWKIAAACDVRDARRRWLGERYPRLRIEAAMEAMCAVAGLDAVVVATPPETHRELAVAALRAGLHVLVEKPVALHAADARAMIHEAERNGRRLRVGFNRRFFSTYGALKERLTGTRAAELRGLRSRMSFDVDGWDSIDGHLGDDRRGGGIVHDVAAHQMDLLSWLCGDTIEAVSVVASSGGAVPRRIEYEVMFSSGSGAACIAEHGRRYGESVEVELAARRFVASEGAVFETRGAPRAWTAVRRRVARVGSIAARLAGRPSAAVESFAAELRSFAAAVREPEADSTAEIRQVLESAVAVDACVRALASPRRWIAVEHP